MGARAAMASALSPRASRAMDAWLLIRGQVVSLNPNATKSEDVRLKLDTDALVAGLDMVDTPKHERAWTWRQVLMLHDAGCHDHGGPKDVCSRHGVTSDVEYEPDCDDCRATFGVESEA